MSNFKRCEENINSIIFSEGSKLGILLNGTNEYYKCILSHDQKAVQVDLYHRGSAEMP